MAEIYRVDVIADIQKYVKPLSDLPGITKANAEKAAIALATSLGKVEGAAAEATAKVVAFNKSLIEQGVSEKAAAAASLSYAKSLAQAGAEADTAAKRAGNLGAAAAGVGQQLSDVASQLATGTNPLTILIQQGPQVVNAISQAGFSLTGLLPILGPVAVAVGVLGAAWYSLSQDLKEAEEAQNRAAAAAEKASQASIRLNSLQAKARDAELIATGKATEKDLELRDALGAVTAEYGPRIEATRAAIAASEAEAAAQAKVLRTSTASNEQLQAAYNAQQKAAQAAEYHRRELAGLEQQQGGLLQTVTRSIVMEAAAAPAVAKTAASRRDAERAIRAQEEALRALSAAMQAENDLAERNQKTYQGAIDAINSVERAQKQATASEAERIDMAYAATLDTIAAEERKALAVSNSVAATETIQQEGERARLAARAAYVQELTKLDEKRNKNAAESLADMEADQRASADRMRSMWTSINGSIGDTFNTLTGSIINSASTATQEAARAIEELQGQIDDITKVELTHAEIAKLEGEALVDAYKNGQVAAKDLTDDQRRQLATSLQMEQNAQKLRQEQAEKAAMTAYKVQKGAALASTLINAGLQVSNAAAAIPYPANIPGIVAATIMGAAQVAAVAASPPPKFHSGTLSAGPGPGAARRGNEFTAVLQGGEAIIPRATMQQPGAKEQAAALVSGRSPVASDEVSKGMDSSSIPAHLQRMSDTLVRLLDETMFQGQLSQGLFGKVKLDDRYYSKLRNRNPRPGHKPRYGAA